VNHFLGILGLAGALSLTTQSTPPRSGLQRVPAPLVAPSAPDPFDAEHWRQRLSNPELDARMFSFEQLARIASEDVRARQQIREWASESDGAELAWTARLLERELARAPSQSQSSGRWRVDPFAPFAFDTFEGFGAPLSLEEFERQLERQFGRQFGPLLRAPGRAPQPWGKSAPQAQRSSSSQIEITPDGVKVRVTEEIDGQQRTEEYSASTLEELYATHPQLRERIGLDSRGAEPRALDSNGWIESPRPGDSLPGFGARTGVRHDILGVVLDELSEKERVELGLSDGVGLRIGRVEPGTLAERLGLTRGQILVELDGESIRTRDDVTRRIKARQPTDELRAAVVNGSGQRSELRWRAALPRAI